jgi:hypothetical protein
MTLRYKTLFLSLITVFIDQYLGYIWTDLVLSHEKIYSNIYKNVRGVLTLWYTVYIRESMCQNNCMNEIEIHSPSIIVLHEMLQTVLYSPKTNTSPQAWMDMRYSRQKGCRKQVLYSLVCAWSWLWTLAMRGCRETADKENQVILRETHAHTAQCSSSMAHCNPNAPCLSQTKGSDNTHNAMLCVRLTKVLTGL